MAPYEPARAMTVEEFRAFANQPSHPPKTVKRPDLISTPSAMNKTEARYALYLDALRQSNEIVSFVFQPFKLRLADLTFWTPDFVVHEPRRHRIVDVKGTLSTKPKPLVKDDAMVKVKVAAREFREHFPTWLFQQAWWTKDGWLHKDFVSRY